MRQGIDCASPIAHPAELKSAGKSFACRYVSTPGNPKNLTHSEAGHLKAAGVDIVVVFETTADRAMAGRAAGAADAKSAREQATTCGMPASRPIYFAVDFDATSHTGAVVEYLAGAASVLTPAHTGVYGGLAAVKAALDAGVCRFAWQTYAWSGGRWDSRAQLQQYDNGKVVAGISCDLDRAPAKDFGQWPAPLRLVGVTVSYIDKQGHRKHSDARSLGRWVVRHPRAWRRGLVECRRRFG